MATITGNNFSNNTVTSIVTLGAGGDVSVAGGAYTIIAASGNSVSLSSSTAGAYTVTASNVASGSTTPFGKATGIFLADATAANITGDSDSVTLSDNDTLTMIGGGNTINAGSAQALYFVEEDGYYYVSSNLRWEGDDSGLYYASNGTTYAVTQVNDVINISNTHGLADILQINGARGAGGITLANSCQANLTGAGNSITLGTGDTLSVIGGSNTISGGTGNTLSVNGYLNTLTISGSTLITLSNTTAFNLKNTVIGDNNLITDNCASHAGVDIFGNGNSVSASQVGAVLNISGNNNTAILSASGSQVILSGSGSHVTATNNTIIQTTAGTLLVTGDGNTLSGVPSSTITNNLSNGTSKVYVWNASNVETIKTYSASNGTGTLTNTQTIYNLDYFESFTGNNSTINASGYNTINGNANTISANPTASMTINGINNKLSINGGYVGLGNSGKLTVTGDGNQFYGVAGSLIIQNTSDGHSQTYSWDASADLLITDFSSINGTGTATLYTIQSGTTITLTAKNASVVIGNNNTVTFTKTGNDVSVAAYGNDITSTSNTFNLDGVAGQQTSFHGNTNTINANNETLNISGNNNLVVGQGDIINQTSANKLKVNGDGNSIFGVAGSTITNNTSNGQSTIYKWNAANVETITTFLLPDGLGLILSVQTIYTVGDNQTKSLTTSDNTVNLGNYATATITGSGNVINAGEGDVINASRNTINAGFGDLINGNRNTIAAVNDAITVNGNNNTINGTGNSIGLTSANTLTVNGDGNVFTGVANATIINNHSDNTSTVYRWNASAAVTCTNYSGIGGTGTITGMGADPLILNLTGGNVDTQGLVGSPVTFDMQNNGKAVQTGWVTAGEGLLVYDPTHHAPVTQDSQLIGSFAQLATLDSNHDGQISALDKAWSDLKVWVDSSGMADFQTSALHSLSDLHIAAISLTATATHIDSHGNTILADGSYTKIDGTTGDIAGVSLSYQTGTDQLINAMASFAPSAAGQASGVVSQHHLLAVPIAVEG
jgi:hypothetical protein